MYVCVCVHIYMCEYVYLYTHTYNHLTTLHRNCSMTRIKFTFLNMASKPFIVYCYQYHHHVCSPISGYFILTYPTYALLHHWSFPDPHARSHFHTLPQLFPLPFSPTTKSSGKLLTELVTSYFPRV